MEVDWKKGYVRPIIIITTADGNWHVFFLLRMWAQYLAENPWKLDLWNAGSM